MAFIFLDVLLHLDTYLQTVVNEYAAFTYVILFLIVFFETGVVVTPFLPGDSLLFAAGALAATGSLRIEWVIFLLFLAAVLGDTVNYHIGKFVGPQVFKKEKSLLFNKDHLVRAQAFYEKHGKKTILLARFIPVIRTFAPFVAGIGTMSYRKFLSYNIIGAAAWCILFIMGGYFFGNIPWVQDHFGIIILAIIFVSFIPLIKDIITQIIEQRKNKLQS
ncbi:DedA family protein [Candidatus Woesearchaeota archaeon]|nr:DedA family protein [Candidatus Woesearchaeota archaeon]